MWRHEFSYKFSDASEEPVTLKIKGAAFPNICKFL